MNLKQKTKYSYKIFTCSPSTYAILKNVSLQMSKELQYYVAVNKLVDALVYQVNTRNPEIYDRIKVDFKDQRQKKMYEMFCRNHKTAYTQRGKYNESSR